MYCVHGEQSKSIRFSGFSAWMFLHILKAFQSGNEHSIPQALHFDSTKHKSQWYAKQTVNMI